MQIQGETVLGGILAAAANFARLLGPFELSAQLLLALFVAMFLLGALSAVSRDAADELAKPITALVWVFVVLIVIVALMGIAIVLMEIFIYYFNWPRSAGQ